MRGPTPVKNNVDVKSWLLLTPDVPYSTGVTRGSWVDSHENRAPPNWYRDHHWRTSIDSPPSLSEPPKYVTRKVTFAEDPEIKKIVEKTKYCCSLQ